MLKMADPTGKVIELVQGNWHPHIAVNWYDDGQGNRVECVRDIKCPEEIRMDEIERRTKRGDHS